MGYGLVKSVPWCYTSDMAYIVAHFRKIDTAGGLTAVVKHNDRENVYDDKMQALGELPAYISSPDLAGMNSLDRVGTKAVHQRRTDRIKQADLIRKPQKNAAVAIEAVYSASPEWFDSHSMGEWQAYFKDLDRWTAQKFGVENIIHKAVHFDEKTPHMHVILTPILNTEKGNKYTSSRFLGGREGLRKIQTDLAESIGKSYGLERGVDGSKARHTNQVEWAAELSKKEAKILTYEEWVKKNAEKGIADFRPPEFNKPKLSAMKQFIASDGTKDLSWKEFVAKETAFEAINHAKKQGMLSGHLRDEIKSLKIEVQKQDRHIKHLTAEVQKFNALSPDDLRSLADRREEKSKKITQTRDIDLGLDR